MSDELTNALRGFSGGAPTREGKVNFDIAPLVENGNTVPITVTVDHPMTADNHVQAIAVFNEKNPQREVVRAGSRRAWAARALPHASAWPPRSSWWRWPS